MYLDLLLLMVILLFSIVGYIQGFVKQILSILCWVSIFLFATPLAHWLKETSGWTWFASAPLLVNWGISALLIVASFMIAGGIIRYAQKGSALEPMDRWIGVGLGALKGVLASLLLAMAFQVVPEGARKHFNELHADAKDSWFVRGSSSLMESRSLSTVESLAQIREALRRGSAAQTGGKSDPWQIDVSADRQ